MVFSILQGSCLDVLPTLEAGSERLSSKIRK